MGQTLTHGIYLPDEGERNCYNGLAGNWQLLDSSVGTIAAHTAALAGKAPAVHTHTKSDITDFPAYGNSAGTICEGNDSRLSDARTPVAHTHTKSDITDLFNSANTWTASNTYNAVNAIIIQNNYVSRGSEPSAYQEQQLKWNDTDGKEIARIKYLNQLTSAGNIANGLELSTTDKFKDGVRDPTGSIISATFRIGLWNDGTKYVYNECRWRSNLLPFGNNTNDVGSSSYQWNNVYSKGYYYNGTPWGLDKENTWTGNNTFQGNLYHKSGSSTLVKGTIPSSTIYYGSFRHMTYDGTEMNLFRGYIGSTGDNCYRWSIEPWVSGSNGRFQMRVSSDGSVRAFEVDGTEVSPYTNNATDLGTSTKRWKTLNGVNPGALSLPDMGTTADVNYFDFTSTITPLDGTDIFYRPPVDGWMTIIIAGTALALFEDASSSNPHVHGSGATAAPVKGYCKATIPVHKNVRVKINAIGTSVYMAQVRPCMGNV